MGFDERVKFLRKENKLNQDDLAEILNIDRSTVGKWEAGKCKPTVDMLVVLADYFKVSTDFLLGLSDTRAEMSERPKTSTIDDNLSGNKRELIKSLIAFSESVPENKTVQILQTIKLIVESD